MTCSFSGCERKHYAKMLCNTHYRQQRANGKLLPTRTRKSADYDLPSLLEWTSASGACRVWSRGGNGYGYGVANHKGKNWMVHRLAYHLATDEELGDAVIHHTCANRGCINPEHLVRASAAENILEMLARRDYEAKIIALEARVKQLEAELDLERSGVAV